MNPVPHPSNEPGEDKAIYSWFADTYGLLHPAVGVGNADPRFFIIRKPRKRVPPSFSMASAMPTLCAAQALNGLNTSGTLSPYPTRITPRGHDYRKPDIAPDSWTVFVEFSDSRRRRKRRKFGYLDSPDRFPTRIRKENSTAAALINNCSTSRGKLPELSNPLKWLINTLRITIQKLTKLYEIERKSCDSCGSCCGCFCDSRSLAAQGIAVVAIVFPLYARAKKWGAGRNIFFFHIRDTRKLPQTIVLFDFIDKYYRLNSRKTVATIARFRAVDRYLLKRAGRKVRLQHATSLVITAPPPRSRDRINDPSAYGPGRPRKAVRFFAEKFGLTGLTRLTTELTG
ncbi:hypothetical protein AMJ96_CH00611 [Rhizobium sp. N113]|nr:hypothetical protein AMJ99_CH00607 [Rhizobium esperanzae]ANL08330.1 hypothetical protein AMJ98_CH00607 [Rhizobium sp. N1341]ANL20379.1 hypothetical protein AMJ96_CH00611 [Rhizobium sp. N113]ANM33053.1 hypothetical protein AMK04_CH00607 [Rhizobium sp. N871]ANM39171.1 hypothetical protein AMK03_CH00607 [Rhizobium sp. N741]